MSISKPNSWMFNKKQEQGLDLCLLLISPEVLYKKNCLFYPHNAATASYQNINVETLKGEKGLENMFSNPISYQKSGKPPQDIFRFHYLLPCETTSDQAEVQSLEGIEPEYILHIFENEIPLTYDEIKSRLDESSYDIGFDELFIKEPQNKVKEEARLSNDFDLMRLKSLIESVNQNVEENKTSGKTNSVRTLLESTGTAKWGESVEPIIQNKDVEEDKASNTGFKIKEFGELPGELPIEKNKTSSKTSTISTSLKSEVNKTVVKPNNYIKSENKKSNIKSSSVSSGGGSSGDGCLGFIILAILIIIFVL
nr:hypothetical protein [uncultured Haemophilus sp.]